MSREAGSDSAMAKALGLDPEQDEDRIALMVELLRRLEAWHGLLQRWEEGPKVKERRGQLAEVLEALKLIERQTRTWNDFGPKGSPDMGRSRVWQRVASHFHLEPSGTLLPGNIVPFESTLYDEANTWPDFLPEVVRALREAVDRTARDYQDLPNTQKSQAARDEVMRDLGLFFHALHRHHAHSWRKTARKEFVHLGLVRLGAGMSVDAVKNRLRQPVFVLQWKQPAAAFGDIPDPIEFDAAAILMALRLVPGAPERATALAPLCASLGVAFQHLLVGHVKHQ